MNEATRTPEQRAEVDLSDVAAELRHIRDYSRDQIVLDTVEAALLFVDEACDRAVHAHFERQQEQQEEDNS